MSNLFSFEKQQDFKLELEYLKNIVDPHYLLSSLGCIIYRETEREIRGPCLIHGGDNKTCFRFNKDTKTWACFSKKCHEDFGNDVISLIQGIHKCPFKDAVDFLKQIVGDVKYNTTKGIEFKRSKECNDFIRYTKKNQLIVPSEVSEDNLKQYINYRTSYFLNQGFKKETLDYFEVGGGFVDKIGNKREVIPIRNEDSILVGYSLRDMSSDGNHDTKYIFTDDLNKDIILYNLNNAMDYLWDRPLIIVEGYKAAWKVYQAGIKNVVAIMGSSFSQGQYRLLFSYAINGIVLFLDNDEAGCKGTLSICKRLRGKIDIFPVMITDTKEDGEGKDPADLSEAEILDYLKGYF